MQAENLYSKELDQENYAISLFTGFCFLYDRKIINRVCAVLRLRHVASSRKKAWRVLILTGIVFFGVKCSNLLLTYTHLQRLINALILQRN